MEYPMGHDWSIYTSETVTGWNVSLNIAQHTIMLGNGNQDAAAMIGNWIKNMFFDILIYVCEHCQIFRIMAIMAIFLSSLVSLNQ